MPAIPIMCMICSRSVREDQFPQHMISVHGTTSQSEAMGNQAQIPPKQAPIVLNKETPPSDEFLQMANDIDKKQEQPKTPNPPVVTAHPSVELTSGGPKSEPIVLKYKYEGNCNTCNVPIRTIVVKAKGQTVAVALCLTHGEVQQREVPSLESEPTHAKLTFQTKEESVRQMLEPERKEAKKNGRHKS